MPDQHQRNNPNWWAARSYRLTASRFYDVCQPTGTKGRQCGRGDRPVPVWVRRQHKSTQWQEDAKNHGIRYEPAALRVVSTYLQREVEECGLFVSPHYHFLAGSPDGVLRDDKGEVTCCVEVKCPFTCYHTNQKPPYMLEDQESGHYKLDPAHRYYYQIQGQLFCTGASECMFAVWTPKYTYITTVTRDDAFIADMLTELCTYYLYSYYPQLMGPHSPDKVKELIPPEIHRQVQDLRDVIPEPPPPPPPAASKKRRVGGGRKRKSVTGTKGEEPKKRAKKC